MGFNVEGLLKDIGVAYKKKEYTHKGTSCVRYELAECFFDASHTKNDACIFQYDTGAVAYKCQHDSCKGRKWKDVRTLLDFKYEVDFGKYWSKTEPGKSEAIPLQFTSCYDICKVPVKRKSIITGFLDERDQTIISGSGGVGKSMFIFFLAYYLANYNPSGGPEDNPMFAFDNMLFGRFFVPKPRTSLFIQSENNRNQVNIRLNKMAGTSSESREALKRIISPVINDDVLTTGKTFHDKETQQWTIDLIHKVEDESGFKLDLLFIDPLISFISRDENDAASMRKDLDGITKIAHAADITPVVTHHNKKDGNGYRGSSAIPDWARNMISLKEEWMSEERITDQSGFETKTRNASVKCIKVDHVKCNNFQMFESFTIRMKQNNKFKLVESFISPEMVEQCNLVCQALKDLGGNADCQKDLVDSCAELSGVSPSTCKRYIATAVDEGFINREKTKKNNRMAYAYSIDE